MPSVLSLVATHTSNTYSFHATDGHFGWANCTVCDSTGQLSITSDWGSWQYRWSPDPKNLGAPTLTSFIGTRGDVDYLARKLQNEGHNGHVFSGERTAEALCRLLCGRRLKDGREQIEYRLEPDDMPGGHLYDDHGLPLFSHNYVKAPTWNDPNRHERRPYLTRDTARTLWDAIRELGDDCDRSMDLFYDRVLRIDAFTDYVTEEPWEYGETEQTPGDRALRELVLPALIEACRAQEAAREQTARPPCTAVEIAAGCGR